MIAPVYGRLYRFTDSSGMMQLLNHQFLLDGESPILLATGVFRQTKWILPEIEKILGDRQLEYLFVSHMEADECGGIALVKKRYPKIMVLCTGFVARQLTGFGYKGKIIVCEPGRRFSAQGLDLSFFSFPAESHGYGAIICFDSVSGVLYGSDAVLHEGPEAVVRMPWSDVVGEIGQSRIPDGEKRDGLKDELTRIRPSFVASGHGSCIEIADPLRPPICP